MKKNFTDKRKIRIVIDTDPGVDDAVALLVAMVCFKADIRLITTTYGNADVETTTKNLFRILTVYRNNYPQPFRKFLIAKGASEPIERKYKPYFKIHGEDALGNSDLPYDVLPLSEKSPEDETYRLVNKFKNKISILCLGPLTNLAKFVLKYPESCKLIQEVVIMGGAFNYPGNYNSKVEANFGWDPDAVDIVRKANFKKITVVPLNVTEQYQVSLADLDSIKSSDFKAILINILKNYIEFYISRKKSFKGGSLHDVVALFCLLYGKSIKKQKFSFKIKKGGRHAGHVYRNTDAKLTKKLSVVTEVDHQVLKEFVYNKLNEYS